MMDEFDNDEAPSELLLMGEVMTSEKAQQEANADYKTEMQAARMNINGNLSRN